MITDLIENDAVLQFQNRNLTDVLDEHEIVIYNEIDRYLDAYADYYKLKCANVLEKHKSFVEKYSKDLAAFEKTGRYPHELNTDNVEFDRTTYDIALILSCLLVLHRFRIMQEVSDFDKTGSETLFVGVGSGLEIALLENTVREYDAYDLNLSDFARSYHSKGNFFESLYTYSGKQYDSILCIELLEHVSDPYGLLAELYKSLNKDGYLLTTTAKDIPQFDHIYNFESEHAFEEKIRNIGFSIDSKAVLEHQNLFSKVNSNNVFYCLRK